MMRVELCFEPKMEYTRIIYGQYCPEQNPYNNLIILDTP